MTAINIVGMFRSGGGYGTLSAAQNYISDTKIAEDYIPRAVILFNDMLTDVVTASITTASTSGNVFNDYLISELALYFADQDYDNIHVDADTRNMENRHFNTALSLMLNAYGSYDPKYGKVVLPKMLGGINAAPYMLVANMTDEGASD